MTGGILGVWDGHDASVALIADGALVFALSEERPSRRKRYSGFPALALDACLAFAEKNDIAVTDVALAGRDGRAPLRVLEPFYRARAPQRDPLSLGNRAVRAWENTLPRLPVLAGIERGLGQAAALRRLRVAFAARGTPLKRVTAVPHHEAHAFSALFGPPRERALVCTWDAYGEGLAATARRAETPDRVLSARRVDAGLAELYGAVTVALGFGEGDEGKVMGLAARGAPEVAAERFRALFESAPEGPRLRRPLSWRTVRTLLAGLSRDDAAAALQQVTEELAAQWIAALLAPEPDLHALLLAGGLFANIRVNEVLAALPQVERLFVFPNMTDGGLSAGAAHRLHHARTGTLGAPLAHAFLGCAFDPTPAVAAARRLGLTVRPCKDSAATAAAHLLEGRVVCRYTGRDEFGPRALGHRSILFAADRSGLGARVNAALVRDDFMPFGPVIRREEAEAEWPAGGSGAAALDLGYMTVSARAGAAFMERAPLAVHRDGSTRPQVVTGTITPGLHRLLTRYRESGGAPGVINTSFNLHGEPIVHTPEDALRTFVAAGLDVLFLEDFEIRAGRP